jgi:tetratricopeptide (TPR) repeat protein
MTKSGRTLTNPGLLIAAFLSIGSFVVPEPSLADINYMTCLPKDVDRSKFFDFYSLKNTDMAALEAFGNLESIRLYSKKLDQQLMSKIAAHKPIVLSLVNCMFTKEAKEKLLEIKSIEVLDISEDNFTDHDLESLKALPRLKNLQAHCMPCASPIGSHILSKAKPDCLIFSQSKREDRSSWKPYATFPDYPGVLPPDYGQKGMGKAAHQIWLSDYDGAEKLDLEALAECKTKGYYLSEIEVEEQLAELCLRLHKFDECRTYCETALKAIKAQHEKFPSTNPGGIVDLILAKAETAIRLTYCECQRLTGKIPAIPALIPVTRPEFCNLSHPDACHFLFYDAAVAISRRNHAAEEHIENILALVDDQQYTDMCEKATILARISREYSFAGDFYQATKWLKRAQENGIKSRADAIYWPASLEALSPLLNAQQGKYKLAEKEYAAVLQKADLFRADSVENLAGICEDCALMMNKIGRFKQYESLMAKAIELRTTPKYRFVDATHSVTVFPAINIDISK